MIGRLFGSGAQSSQLFIALLSDILGSQVRGVDLTSLTHTTRNDLESLKVQQMRRNGLRGLSFGARVALRLIKVLAAYQSLVRLLCESIDWSVSCLLIQFPPSPPEAPL